MKRSLCLVASMALGSCAPPATVQSTPPPPPSVAPFASAQMSPEERRESNDDAKLLLDIEGRIEPEAAVQLGVTGLDERVTDWKKGSVQAEIDAFVAAEKRLAELEAKATSRAVRTDLGVLRAAANRAHRGREIEARTEVVLYDPAHRVFDGLSSLLAKEATKEQRAAALVRLRAYADGAEPLAKQAEARMREQLGNKSLLMPPKDAVERAIANTPKLCAELKELFADRAEAGPSLSDRAATSTPAGPQRAGVEASSALLERLEAQLRAYASFLDKEILPGARRDFHLPPELYAFRLEERGVDVAPDELSKRARVIFSEIQAEMQVVAKDVARAHGFPNADYRAVLRELKKAQIPALELDALYRKRIAEIEGILKKERIVSLPDRALAFRMATEAESGLMPAPMYLPPPLLDGKGRAGTFVLVSKGASGGYDDFSFDAASWWLTAHEGRPGHDLQYSTMAAHPPTIARAVYASNSVNAEGWGLYAESLIEPFVPVEAKLVILQARLMRAAHAFLDIDLNLGRIEPAEVIRVMTEEVVFSDAWAKTSLRRYTTLMPGQAPSYLYGYLCLRELRRDAEARLGSRFQPLAFHDAVLALGLLPPKLMRTALLGD